MPAIYQLTRSLQTLAHMNPARCCLGRVPQSQAIVTCFTPLQQHTHTRAAAVQPNAWHSSLPLQSLGPCVISSRGRCSSGSGTGSSSRSSWSSSRPGRAARPDLVCHASGSASNQPGSSTVSTVRYVCSVLLLAGHLVHAATAGPGQSRFQEHMKLHAA